MQVVEESDYSTPDPTLSNEGQGKVLGYSVLEDNGDSSSSPVPKRHGSNPPELQTTAVQIKQAFDTLNNVFNRIDESEDECDLFGRLVAKKLRRLPEYERDDLMYEIEGLFHRRLRCISKLSSTDC